MKFDCRYDGVLVIRNGTLADFLSWFSSFRLGDDSHVCITIEDIIDEVNKE